MTGRFTGANYAVDYEKQAREVDALNKHLDMGAEWF